MKVYGVGTEYDEVYDIVAVFSTREKADAYASRLRAERAASRLCAKRAARAHPSWPYRDDVDVIEWELDKEPGE